MANSTQRSAAACRAVTPSGEEEDVVEQLAAHQLADRIAGDDEDRCHQWISNFDSRTYARRRPAAVERAVPSASSTYRPPCGSRGTAGRNPAAASACTDR